MKFRFTVTLVFSVGVSCFSSLVFGQDLIPENASAYITSTESGWVCNPGYKPKGIDCLKFDLPDNALLYGLGNTWRCMRGYRKESQQCSKLLVPLNASLDIVGNNWACNKGYRKDGGLCLVLSN